MRRFFWLTVILGALTILGMVAATVPGSDRPTSAQLALGAHKAHLPLVGRFTRSDLATAAQQPGSGWIYFGNTNEVHEIAVDKRSGVLWAATEGGLVKWYPDDSTHIVYSHQPINLVAVDAEGGVWFGPVRRGDDYFAVQRLAPDGSRQTFGTADGLTGGYLRDIVADDAGNVWLAFDGELTSVGGGLNRWSPRAGWRSYQADDGLPGQSVRGVTSDRQGGVWIHYGDRDTRGEDAYFGISHLAADGQLTNHDRANGFPTDIIRSIAVAPDGTVLMVEGDSLQSSLRIIQGTPESGWTTLPWPEEVWEPGPRTVDSIAIDDRGNRWFFSRYAFARWAPDGRWTVFRQDADGEMLARDSSLDVLWDPFYRATMAFGGDGSNYFHADGSDAGFFQLSEAGNWRRFHTDDPPVGRDVAAVASDSTGRVWLTSGNLIERRRDGTWVGAPPTSDIGVDSDVLVTDPQNRMWMTDYAALWRVDLTTPDRRRYDKADGLDVGSIQDMAVDPAGAMWVGGSNGLSRQLADGRWEAVTLPDPSMSRIVIDIDFDRQGGAWVGIAGRRDPTDANHPVTSPGGVLHRDPSGHWQTFSVSDGLINDAITALSIDRAGNLWVGHDSGPLGEVGGATRLAADGTLTRFTAVDGLNGAVQAIEADRDGSIWFGTRNGLDRRSPSGVWSTFTSEIQMRSGSAWVSTLLADPDGSLWIGVVGSREVLWRRRTDGSIDAYPLPFISGSRSRLALAVDPRGGILVGWTNQRIERIESDGTMSTLIVVDRLDAYAYVRDLVPDARGQLWAATFDGLARQGTDGSWRTFHTADGLPGPLVEAAVVDPADGSVWVGAGPTQPDFSSTRRSGGLCHLVGDGPCQPVDVPDMAAGKGVRTVALDNAGGIWLSTYEIGKRGGDVGTGVHRRDRAGQWAHYDASDDLPSNDVRAIAVDASGNIWFATNKGLGHLVPASIQTGASWLNDFVRSLIESDDGGAWTTLTMADGLPSNEIRTVSIAPDGALWVGTADGVSRRGGDGTWRSWGTSQGLSAPIVVDIAFDPVGNAWLATTGGGVSVLLRQW